MSIPRDAWWEKWNRAEEHRHLLADEIVETFSDEENCVRIAPERGAQPGEYLFRVKAVHTAPLMRWALVIGDVVHNLRASLDHLAWRLALIHSRGRRPIRANRIVFPIYDQARKFRDSESRANFDGFHWAMFEGFQPYQGRRGADNWSGEYIPQLALLQALTNRDKHQHLTPILLPPTAYTFPGGLFPAGPGDQWPPWDLGGLIVSSDPLELGAVAMRVRTRNLGIKPKMNVDSYVAPSVSLPRYGPIIPALERIGRYVRRVLAEFDPLI